MATVEATITKVTQDAGTGWYSIELDDERVKKLQTKMQDKASEAAALMKAKAHARIEFSEREGNMNERTGRPYMNRYYERGEALAAAPADDGIEIVQQTSRRTDPGDAWRICLAAGAKLAVGMMPMVRVEERTLQHQQQIAIQWAVFFMTTQPPDFDAPPPDDDDIPF